MAASSSCSQKFDVFPSFSGVDVRPAFLNHLLEAIDCYGSLNIFKDHEINRSRQIGPEILSAIREARISIVIFSIHYASSKWCLDELAEIHNCYKELNQKVIPIFYKVFSSEVRKQKGKFGESFMITCMGKSDDEKQKWQQALTDLAYIAGEDLHNWSNEASMVKKIANDVFNIFMETLRVSYYRLDEKAQDIFLWIACLFNGESAKSINNFFGDGNAGLQRLAENSLVRISNEGVVEMHNFLEKFGREIDHAESKRNPLGKCRFLTDVKEILDIFTNQTGTGTLHGIFFNASLPSRPFYSIGEKSFEGMIRLQFLRIRNPFLLWAEPIFRLPNGLAYLPPKLKYLDWNRYPLKHLPSNFKAEFLVELRMEYSELEKMWEGTQELGSLKTIIMSGSIYLKEIPNLSKAINLEKVDLSGCHKLENFTVPPNLEYLEYLNLIRCSRLANFPQIKMERLSHGIEIMIQDCLWNKNLPGPDYLDCLRKCYPLRFLPEHLVHLEVKGSTMEKLCEGVQPLGSLQTMTLSRSKSLKEIPDLSKATNLKGLDLSHCKSLVMLPSTIRNLQKLERLEMKNCTRLEVLPVDVKLSSLKTLNLNGCSSLKSFPQILHSIEELYLDHTSIGEVPCCIMMLPRLVELSMRGCSKLTSFPQLSPSIEKLNLDDTAIEEVSCYIEMFWRLTQLSMRGCKELKNISPNIFRLTNLKKVDFTDCGTVVTALNDSTVAAKIKAPYYHTEKGNTVDKDKDKFDKDKDEYEYNHLYFHFQNCLQLDRDARELIIQSSLKWTMVLPGGELPTYFKHCADGNSLTVSLPQSILSHNFLRVNVCVVVKRLASFSLPVYLHFRFNGGFYKHKVYLHATQMWKMDHLVLFSFKFRLTGLPAKLAINDVEFKFEAVGNQGIKEFGIRLLNVSPRRDDIDGFIAPNLELPLERGESSSVSSYPSLEGEALCTEQQDAQIPIVDPTESET